MRVYTRNASFFYSLRITCDSIDSNVYYNINMIQNTKQLDYRVYKGVKIEYVYCGIKREYQVVDYNIGRYTTLKSICDQINYHINKI